MSDTVRFQFESISSAHAAIAEAADHNVLLHLVEENNRAFVEVAAAVVEQVQVLLLRHGGTQVPANA